MNIGCVTPNKHNTHNALCVNYVFNIRNCMKCWWIWSVDEYGDNSKWEDKWLNEVNWFGITDVRLLRIKRKYWLLNVKNEVKILNVRLCGRSVECCFVEVLECYPSNIIIKSPFIFSNIIRCLFPIYKMEWRFSLNIKVQIYHKRSRLNIDIRHAEFQWITS